MGKEKQSTFETEYNDYIPSETDEISLDNKKQKKTSHRKKILIKSLKIIVYTICVSLITVFVTLIIQYNISESSLHPMTYPYKSKPSVEKFDRFVAFGGHGVSGWLDKEVLLNCNLISDEDKSILKEYTITNEVNGGAFNLYLGVKDGKDIIELHHMCSPWKNLAFELKVNYKLESIISDFEQMSGEILTEEFLNESKSDGELRQISGIQINFKLLEDGTYGHYYTTFLNGNVYIIDK